MGEKAVSAVEGLERRGLPVKLHFWKCLECLIPLDLEDVTRYMSSTTLTVPMFSMMATHLKTQRLWEQHLCNPEHDLVDPSRKTLAQQARCEQCLLFKTHISFKVYDLKWSPQNYRAPWKYVVIVAMWSDPTYSVLRDALERPIVNPELNIAPDVNFLTVDIGSDSDKTGVAYIEKLERVMHVTGIAPSTPLHTTVANMPYCLIIFEVPSGLMEGIHYVVGRNWVSGTLVLLVGDACDVAGAVDGLWKLHDNEGPTTIRIGCFNLGSLTPQSSMGFTGLQVISKNPLAKKVFLLVPASCYQRIDSRHL